jgi:hypothetical protein
MALPKSANRTQSPRRKSDDKVKDEVYRQMFRLEANRPRAEIELSLLLLDAWLATESESGAQNMREC